MINKKSANLLCYCADIGGGKRNLAADTGGGQITAELGGSLDKDAGKDGHGVGHESLDSLGAHVVTGTSAVAITLR